MKRTEMMKYFDPGIIIVIVITVLLFTVALFVKGFTNALLLEAGVLLVSIKLIMMAYRNSINYSDLKKDLNEIKRLLEEKSQNTMK
jgi:protein-S-isoprenylcysteine O-methyltransferase Ste14